MELKFAEYIVALDEERNITRAAAKLKISQSALSNFLIKHEKENGMRIFVRYRNTLIPTEKGQHYISALRQMCTLKTYAYQRIRTYCGQINDEIRIGVTPSQGMNYLTDSYSMFVKSYPSTKLNIVEDYSANLKTRLLDNVIDMFFGATSELEDQSKQWFHYRALPVQLVAVMHRYLAADLIQAERGEGRTFITCEQLQGMPIILHGKKTSMRVAQDEFFIRERFTPVIIAEANNSHMIKGLVRRGLGVGFLPEQDVDLGEMKDTVCFHLEALPCIYRGIAIRKEYELSRSEEYLAELLWSYEVKKGERHAATAD